MKRRDFIRLTGGAAAALLGGASGVMADAVGDDIARQLRRRGYSDINVTRTLLGRVRVTGRRGMLEREIIVNPNSGEILRDLVIDSRTGTTSSSLFEDGGSDGRSGSSSGGSEATTVMTGMAMTTAVEAADRATVAVPAAIQAAADPAATRQRQFRQQLWQRRFRQQFGQQRFRRQRRRRKR